MQVGAPALEGRYDAKAVALPANASSILAPSSISAGTDPTHAEVTYAIMDGVRATAPPLIRF
eukprot:7890292-Pyramimonas_sp.AAC.1